MVTANFRIDHQSLITMNRKRTLCIYGCKAFIKILLSLNWLNFIFDFPKIHCASAMLLPMMFAKWKRWNVNEQRKFSEVDNGTDNSCRHIRNNPACCSVFTLDHLIDGLVCCYGDFSLNATRYFGYVRSYCLF